MNFANVHLVLHFLLPALISRWLWPDKWRKATLILCATILVDLDHLLATPIYAPERCSIDFHPLHQLEIIPLYVLLACIKSTRLVGLGLCIHMLLDALDCWL